MESNPIPASLDWVRTRAECSIQHVFKELELGVREDCEKAQSLVPSQAQTKFSVTKVMGSRFAVVRVDDPITSISQSVYFTCKRNEIQVHKEGSVGNELQMSATLTLTNSGECKLKVGSEELYQWQFRRMALEDLFFSPAQ